MDDQKLVNAINKSPLQEEDKKYWKELLNRMSREQKQRLYHTVVVKTDVKRASEEIKTALDIINKALEEEQSSSTAAAPPKQPPPGVVQDIVENTKVDEHVPQQKLDDPEHIKQKHEEVQQRLKELRGELSQISQEVSGENPPSYQQNTA